MLRLMQKRGSRKSERGATLPEFAIGGLVFITAIFGIIELSRLFWTHNALTDAVRRGSRYAATVSNSTASQTAIKNMVVYGNTAGTGTSMIFGLTTAHVTVTYSSAYDTKNGSVTVSIPKGQYVFNLNIPLIGSSVSMPEYKAIVTAESAGRIPSDL
jgi:Flp pilus assembly protein TadG